MEGERFRNTRPDRLWVRADRLEFADVVVLTLRCSLQRPGLRDVFLPHIQQAVADRRQQPLMQADTVVITLEVAQCEGEVGQGMGTVDDRKNPSRPSETAEPLDGKELPGQV